MKDMFAIYTLYIFPILGEDESFLRVLHEICCKKHIVEGTMTCQNCKREYAIRNGIANMLLNEDEV